jgi:hypothetical protein
MIIETPRESWTSMIAQYESPIADKSGAETKGGLSRSEGS